MKIYYETEDNDIIIQMTKKEAQDFDEILHIAMYLKDKKLSKRSRAFKLAEKISDLMPIW